MPRKAVGLVAGVFLLGIALGALGARLWDCHMRAASARRHGHVVQELKAELQLTPDQGKQFDAIIADTQGKFHALYEQERPQWDQVREQGRVRIRAILTAEQRPKFDAFVRRLDEQRKKEEGQ